MFSLKDQIQAKNPLKRASKVPANQTVFPSEGF